MASCSNCGEEGHNTRTCTGYADYHCRYCKHDFRVTGNGGLVFGMYPSCPDCGSSYAMLDTVEQG